MGIKVMTSCVCILTPAATLTVVQGLAKLLADYAPGCCREQKYDNYFGRKIAIDASMHIYQALVGVFHIC